MSGGVGGGHWHRKRTQQAPPHPGPWEHPPTTTRRDLRGADAPRITPGHIAPGFLGAAWDLGAGWHGVASALPPAISSGMFRPRRAVVRRGTGPRADFGLAHPPLLVAPAPMWVIPRGGPATGLLPVSVFFAGRLFGATRRGIRGTLAAGRARQSTSPHSRLGDRPSPFHQLLRGLSLNCAYLGGPLV